MKKENVLRVYNEVKKLEEIYNPYDKATIEDIENCYTDKYILDLWEDEKESWLDFESFLIDYAENGMMYE